MANRCREKYNQVTKLSCLGCSDLKKKSAAEISGIGRDLSGARDLEYNKNMCLW